MSDVISLKILYYNEQYIDRVCNERICEEYEYTVISIALTFWNL